MTLKKSKSSHRATKFDLENELDAALERAGIKNEQIEALLSEIDDTVSGWSDHKLLMALFRIEYLLGKRHFDLRPGRTLGAKTTDGLHIAFQEAGTKINQSRLEWERQNPGKRFKLLQAIRTAIELDPRLPAGDSTINAIRREAKALHRIS